LGKLGTYEQQLLEGWEAVYKKSQLTLWVLLALKDGPKYMAKIKEFIVLRSKGTITADDQSMYRALRRFHDADMVDFREQTSKGPDRKVYHLTDTGSEVLKAFIGQNISQIFLAKENKRLFS
jgi:DNA-binding PadR family transcriptional regulator